MWVGAAIFLSFMWGGGFWSTIQSYDKNKIKVIRRVGSKDDPRR